MMKGWKRGLIRGGDNGGVEKGVINIWGRSVARMKGLIRGVFRGGVEGKGGLED